MGEKEKEEKREKKEKREKRSQQSMGNPLPFPLIFAFLPPLLGPSHHFFLIRRPLPVVSIDTRPSLMPPRWSFLVEHL